MSISTFFEDLDSRIERAKPRAIRWLIVAGIGALVIVSARWAYGEYRSKKHREKWVSFSANLAAGGGWVSLLTEPADAVPAVRELTGGAWADLAAVYESALGDEVLGGQKPGLDFEGARSDLASLGSIPSIRSSAQDTLLPLNESGATGFDALERRLEECQIWYQSHPRLASNDLPAESPRLELSLAGGSNLSIRLDEGVGSGALDGLAAVLSRPELKGATMDLDLELNLWRLKVPETEGSTLAEDLHKALDSFRESRSSLSLFPGTLCALIEPGETLKHSLVVTPKDSISNRMVGFKARPIGYVVGGSENVVLENLEFTKPSLTIDAISLHR